MNQMFEHEQSEGEKKRYGAAASADFCWLAIDLETGGYRPKDADIVEIAAVAYKGGSEVGAFDHLVIPERPWNKKAEEEAHHISEAEAREQGIPCRRALEHLIKWASKAQAIVAYNHKFDKNFVMYYCEFYELDFPQIPWLDPFEIGQILLAGKGLANLKLTTVAKHFGVPLPQAHRAEPDARAAGNVLLEMLVAEGLTLDEVATSGIRQIGSNAIGMPVCDAIYDAFPHQFKGKAKSKGKK